MQAHRNVIVIGITAAVILGPTVPVNAQSSVPTESESALTRASKPQSKTPRSWTTEPLLQSVTDGAAPESISAVYQGGERSPAAILLTQSAVDEPAETLRDVDQAEPPNDDALGNPDIDSDNADGAPLTDDLSDEPGIEDELDAAEEADLESVTEVLDEDDGDEADIPEEALEDPLSQPLEVENGDGGEALDDLDPSEPVPDAADGDDGPSPLVQDVLEALRAPANPLFFPTNPETLEVTETVPITLEQALQVAYRNSRDLQTAQLQLEQSQAAVQEALAERFPNLRAGSSYSRTTINQFSDGGQSFGPGGVTPGGNVTETNNTLSGTVSLDYDLFTSGARRARIRAAREARRLQELQLEVVAEEITLNVTQAYYDIQEADETVRINRDNLDEALISFRDARARELAGVGTRFDRLQAQVEVANARQDLRNAISNQLVTQRQLVELLSLPPGLNVTAADDVDIAGLWQLSLAESLALAYKNRAELEQQVVERELNRQQRRVARANTLPQVGLSAQYQFQDLLDETRSPTGQDRDSFTIQAQLSWLFFDGGASRARARQEGLDIEIAETEFADTREAVRFDVEQAFFNLESNLENIQTAQAAVQLAEESLRLARLRFQAGVGIQSDVIQAQTDLTEAEANLVTAVLGYNRALVSIQRAVSNLPDNNLSDIPPGNI